MKGIANRIHSWYSRATSKQGTPGISEICGKERNLHSREQETLPYPGMARKSWKKLVPAEDGFYCLKRDSIVLEESRV